MREVEHVSQLIGDIYDAALDPSLWVGVLEKISGSTRLYIEWARPQGYADATVAVIEKSAIRVALLATAHYDRDSPVDETVRRRMSLIVPHVRRAVAVSEIIDLHKVEAAMLGDAVDALAVGVFFIGGGGRIVRANGIGREMLFAGNIIRETAGALVATDPKARRVLEEAITDALQGDAALGAKGIGIVLTAPAGERFVAHVLPLSGGARRQAPRIDAAVAAVFVHEATADRPLPLEALAQHFMLTPMELRVLVAIMEVGGTPEVAAVLGIAESTVRTHLYRLFEKMGASRQVDLVKIITGFFSPLAR